MEGASPSDSDARVGIQPRGLPLKHPGASYLNSLPPVTHPENGMMRRHSFSGLNEGKCGRPLLPSTVSRRGAGGQLPSACMGVRGSLPSPQDPGPDRPPATSVTITARLQRSETGQRPSRARPPGAPFICMR